MDLKKARCKKQGHCYSKREEARLPYFGPDLFFKVPDPKKISGRPDKLE